MWVPANKDALPTMEEMQCAKGVIKELEIMLKDAVELLEQAKARVIALTKDLEERQAWIAPIRKLPFEILSEIFIFTSEVDDLSPVTITEVCRVWQKVVISTPRAWSLIYADRLKDINIGWGGYVKPDGLPPQYFSTFIERSNPRMLHISVPRDEYYEISDIRHFHPVEALRSAVHRIQCLSVTSWQLVHFAPEAFLNLTKLTLLSGEYEIEPSFFTRSRFPCLRYLDCLNCLMDHSPQSGTMLFPPLQHLAINAEEDGWFELVQGCANSLVGLKVLSGGALPIPRATISFPKLDSLTFWTVSGVPMPIQARTPALRSYEQMVRDYDGTQHPVFHDDIKKITHLCTDLLLDLADFATLRVLQFELAHHESPVHMIHTILHSLKENKDMYPALQTIRFHLPTEVYEDAGFKAMIPSFDNSAQRARPRITLWFTDEPPEPLSGSVEEAQVCIKFRVL